jgi:hypothetical protein
LVEAEFRRLQHQALHVQVSVDGTPRRFVHDESGRVTGEYGATGTVFAEHVWLMPDTDEGGWEPLALLGASTLSYVHGDHLGVPVQITDAGGATGPVRRRSTSGRPNMVVWRCPRRSGCARWRMRTPS